MPASAIGATYGSGRRPKAAKERTRGGWGAENYAHYAMGELADPEGVSAGAPCRAQAAGYLAGRQR